VAYSIWNLSFEERPNYEYLIKYFTKQVRMLHTLDDTSFDWNIPEDGTRHLGPQDIQKTLNLFRPSGEAINYIPEVR